MKFKIDYDTVSYASIITCIDETIHKNLKQFIEENKDRRITGWIESLVEKIKEENNNDPFSIEISGCDIYEKKIIDSILNHNKQYINSSKMDCVDEALIQAKYDKIDDFINYAQSSKQEIVLNAFKPKINDVKSLRNNTVEIPVIATMSSGKSTLLNALIGQDFLSEDTGTTTATICNVLLHSNFKVFEAKAINNNIEIAKSNNDIKSFLKEWNLKANTKEYSNLKLIVEGPPVTGFDTSNLRINFVDTPGPNSSRYANHRVQTINYLKDQEKSPIILYVLDPQKMESKDDDDLLKEISGIIGENKQDLNRIIFVYNKIDEELDRENTYEDVLTKIKKFLSDSGIDKPKIFPVSASYAKLAILNQNSLDRNQKKDLENFNFKFAPDAKDNYLGYPLLNHVPLTDIQKSHLQDKIVEGVDLDVIYSGLASIQLYIDDYISNQHRKDKYQHLLTISRDIFNSIETNISLRKDDLIDKTNDELEKNKKKSQLEIEELNKLKVQVLNQVDKIQPNMNFIQDIEKKIQSSLDSYQGKVNKANNLNENQINSLITEGNKLIEYLKISIKTDLISNMNKESSNYLRKLKEEVITSFSLETPSLKSKTFNAEMLNKVNVLDLAMTDSYKIVKMEQKERSIQKKIDSKWKIRRWLNWKVNVKEIVQYKTKKTTFDKTKFKNQFVSPRTKEVNQIVRTKIVEFYDTIAVYEKVFRQHVDISFEESMNHVYMSFNDESLLVEGNRKNKISELDKVINDLSIFKI